MRPSGRRVRLTYFMGDAPPVHARAPERPPLHGGQRPVELDRLRRPFLRLPGPAGREALDQIVEVAPPPATRPSAQGDGRDVLALEEADERAGGEAQVVPGRLQVH